MNKQLTKPELIRLLCAEPTFYQNNLQYFSILDQNLNTISKNAFSHIVKSYINKSFMELHSWQTRSPVRISSKSITSIR